MADDTKRQSYQLVNPPPYEDEWYEDTVDLNMKAFSLTEDEWQEEELKKLQRPTTEPQ